MADGSGSSVTSEYWEWLKQIPSTLNPLAWCHMTEAVHFRTMIRSGYILKPTRCKHFKEKLLYFFYGRPAYKTNSKATPMSNDFVAPVVLILSPELTVDSHRLHPFDTGAFLDTLMNKWFHRTSTISQFEMDAHDGGAQRHIAAFFGTNDAYLKLNPCSPLLPTGGYFEAGGIKIMLNSIGSEHADDRRMCPELQCKKDINFNSVKLLAVILPSELKESNADYMRHFVTKFKSKVEIITYDASPNKAAIEYQGELERLAIEFQKRNNFV